MLISLVGLPGVGKSTIGRRLARRLGFPFVDCDGLLEERFGCRIRDYFATEGEERFRDAESRLLAELTEQEGTVLATGGGAVIRADNRRLLRMKTFCVFLDAEPGALMRRLRRDTTRPLLQVADPEARLRELSAERVPLYRESAALVLDMRQHSLASAVEAIARNVAPNASAGEALTGMREVRE